MNKKLPVGINPRDISNDWREKNARIVKRILRDSIINTARLMKMLPEGVVPIHICEITQGIYD